MAVLLMAGPGRIDAQESRTCDGVLIRGVVTDDTETVALPAATIVVQWGDLLRRPTRIQSGADGTFELCAPEKAVDAVVWAEFGDYTSAQESVTLDGGAQLQVSLRIALESLPEARIVGRVVDAESNDPVAGAAIGIIDGVVGSTTNSRGDFVLMGVPPGHYRLDIRHLGYEPLRQEIDAPSGRTLDVQVGLTRRPIEVEPLVATVVRSRKLENQGFYERKFWGEALGLGKFFTAHDIERRQPLRISHMLADAPGIKLRCSGSGMKNCHLEGRAGCALNAYIDGVPLRGTGSIDEYILPVQIGGVEVYASTAQLPAEFGGSDARCGAVVIWTR